MGNSKMMDDLKDTVESIHQSHEERLEMELYNNFIHDLKLRVHLMFRVVKRGQASLCRARALNGELDAIIKTLKKHERYLPHGRNLSRLIRTLQFVFRILERRKRELEMKKKKRSLNWCKKCIAGKKAKEVADSKILKLND